MEMPVNLVRSHTHHWTFPSTPRHRPVVSSPKVRGIDLWHIISYRPRDRKRPVMVPPVNTPESLSRSESSSDISSQKDPRTSRNSGKSSAGTGQRVPILGPTRQQTEIYFKNVRRRERTSCSLRGMNINVPHPTEPSTFRKSQSEGSAKSTDRSPDLDPSDSPSKFKATLSKLTSSSLSSLPKRNHSTSFDPDQQGYNDIRFLAELVKPLQYRLRVSNKERREKVIIPSKHGYHPRSQSPTFKRLLEATEKLNVLCESDSLEGQVRRNYSHINNDIDAPLVPLKNGERLARVTNGRVKPSHTTPYITDATANTKTAPKTDNGHTVPDKLEIPKHFPNSEDAISEEGDNSDSSSTKSDEVYFKVDFKEEDAHAELHLFLPHISEPVTGRGTSPDSKNGLTNGKAATSSRVTLPSIPRQSNILSQKTFPKKANNKNNVKKKKKKLDNRCPSAKDNDRKVSDHLNDVPTLISMNYENGHHERRDPHGDDTICDVANCPFHSLMAVARAETYV